MKGNYYNENDPYAAQWLRNLIEARHIPAGDVDERSIEDVQTEDLKGYNQCHFFAGIAGWSEALRLAGWPDERPVWTGSCPCQPLSSAGQRKGHADKRHLWPAFHNLIAQSKPPVVFGEQVASKDGREWLAGVRTDLEASGYACGCADLCAASTGAPHIRQRLFWVAQSVGEQAISAATGRLYAKPSERGSTSQLAHPQGIRRGMGNPTHEREAEREVNTPGDDSESGGMADAGYTERGPRYQPCNPKGRNLHEQKREEGSAESGQRGEDGGMDDPSRIRRQHEPDNRCGDGTRSQPQEQGCESSDRRLHGWQAVEFIECADGKARPTQPGIHPLADGFQGRVGQLRAYGNAIVPPLASAFIQSAMEAMKK